MLDELVGELERRIRDDRFGAFRRPALQQEVDFEVARRTDRRAVIDEVGRDDGMAGSAQHVDDRAATTCRLPNPKSGSLSTHNSASVVTGGVS